MGLPSVCLQRRTQATRCIVVSVKTVNAPRAFVYLFGFNFGIAYSSLCYIKPFIHKKNLASISCRPFGVTNVDV